MSDAEGKNGVIAVDAGVSHTLALRSDGSVLAWGYNPYGALGDNTTTERNTPTTVVTTAGTGTLTGAVQVSMMSQLGDRISIIGAVAFATLFTAIVSVALLLIFRRSFNAYRDAFNHPWWMLMGGLLGLLIVFTITYAGGRLGVAATVGILIAGQLLMGAAIDRFGLFGSMKIPLHWPRVLGIALLGVGAALSLKK